ncbi:hypothetical protein, partial [Klebsiella pneumoniae]|uniref:hypothetical protein n=1 Tax=Klebsiella pneumoniae TaxID=573 RepID=UPI001E630126
MVQIPFPDRFGKRAVFGFLPGELRIIILADGFAQYFKGFPGNDSNLLIVFYVQIMPDDFVMQL